MPSNSSATGTREAALTEFIEAFVAEQAPLARAYHEAVWQAETTGEKQFSDSAADLGTKLRQMLARPEAWTLLSGIEAAGGVGEPRLARQLKLLIDEHRAQQIPAATVARTVQMEKALEHKLSTFRAELDGAQISDNEIVKLLRESDDIGLRRRAWEASKQSGAAIVEDLLALVRQRNESAREIGYPDYYTMMLELREIEPDELFGILDRVEQGTRPLFQDWRARLDARLKTRFGVAPEDVRPWHMSDPFFQVAPAADLTLDRYFESGELEAKALAFFDAIGLDVHEVMANADLYERSGKSQHAFCLPLDHDGDVRVLCNLRPDEKWMGTLLHELGHAAYERYIDPQLPYLLRENAHIMSTEASAMLFGRLSRNAAWLERYAGVPADEAARIAADAREAVRVQLLLSTRWILVMCHMERALYADPEQDLNTLWWDLVERFQMLKRPDGRSAPDWASKMHFTAAPVYYHNYLLGEMTASQLQRHLIGNVLGGGADALRRYVTDPAVGRFMIEQFYRTGTLYPWNETLRRATGETLDPEYFIRDLTPGD
jgi:peptidyl-dipeptidase A